MSILITKENINMSKESKFENENKEIKDKLRMVKEKNFILFLLSMNMI